MLGRTIHYRGKAWKVIEDKGTREIYKVLTIKSGRKTLNVEADMYSGQIIEK